VSDAKAFPDQNHFIAYSAPATKTNVFASGTGQVLYAMSATSFAVNGLYARGYTTLYRASTSWSGTANFVNFDVDAWTFSWAADATGKAYRQYTFDLKVTDSAGNPVNLATVQLKDKSSGTVFTVTTNSTGDIPTQTVSRGYYNQANGNTLQDYSPHTLTIVKTGYTTYTQKFTLTGKTS
jgi:hypothetical protein